MILDIAALAREATALLSTDDPERRAAYMRAKAEALAVVARDATP